MANMFLNFLLGTALAARPLIRVHHGPGPTNRLPVVFWHGMGDQCDDPNTMGVVVNQTILTLDTFVLSICVAEGEGDRTATYLGNVNEQIQSVCAQLSTIEELSSGFHAIGFSQGGLFLRALVERCPAVKISVLITMGSPHQGVAALPGCPPGAKTSCGTSEALVRTGAYWSWVQRKVVQATYFKDPSNLKKYLEACILLPDINNEREEKNGEFKARLQGLKKLVLFRFENDTTLVPRDTAWFYEYTKDDGLVPLEDTPLFTEDWIGLQTLQRTGRLVLDTAPGEHMHISMDFFVARVLKKYLL